MGATQGTTALSGSKLANAIAANQAKTGGGSTGGSTGSTSTGSTGSTGTGGAGWNGTGVNAAGGSYNAGQAGNTGNPNSALAKAIAANAAKVAAGGGPTTQYSTGFQNTVAGIKAGTYNPAGNTAIPGYTGPTNPGTGTVDANGNPVQTPEQKAYYDYLSGVNKATQTVNPVTNSLQDQYQKNIDAENAAADAQATALQTKYDAIAQSLTNQQTQDVSQGKGTLAGIYGNNFDSSEAPYVNAIRDKDQAGITAQQNEGAAQVAALRGEQAKTIAGMSLDQAKTMISQKQLDLDTIYKMGQLANMTSDNAQALLKWTTDSFGSVGLKNLSPQAKAEIEAKIGMQPGDVDKLTEGLSLKEQNAAALAALNQQKQDFADRKMTLDEKKTDAQILLMQEQGKHLDALISKIQSGGSGGSTAANKQAAEDFKTDFAKYRSTLTSTDHNAQMQQIADWKAKYPGSEASAAIDAAVKTLNWMGGA